MYMPNNQKMYMQNKQNANISDCVEITLNGARNERTITNNDLRIEVTNIILELGVPANIKGYSYLREAIILKFDSSDNAMSMTKILYPSIANMFDTSAARVERAMRHAVEVAWIRGDPISRQKIFSYVVSHSKLKPTNSEFIDTIADRLKLQYHVNRR